MKPLSDTHIGRILLLATILYLALFAYRQYLPTVDIMEARNLVSAREVVASGEWLLPTLNGEPRIAKPPLPTWIAATAQIFASSDTDLSALRFASGCAALGLTLFAYLLIRKLSDGESAYFAAIVTATSLLTMVMARKATWDIFAFAFMMPAVWFLFRGWRTGRWRHFLLSAFLMGLSWLSKGPVAFFSMLLPFVAAYLIVYRPPFPKNTTGKHLALATLVLVVAAAWPLYLHIMVPETLEEISRREVSAWAHHHVRPFWYYVKFPLEMGIWAVVAAVLLWYPFGRGKLPQRPFRFAYLWLLFTLLLLSAVPEKKIRYAFPAVVPASMLVGLYFAYLKRASRKGLTRGDRLLWKLFSLSVPLLLTAIVGYALYAALKEKEAFRYAPLLAGGFAATLWSYRTLLWRPLRKEAATVVPHTALSALLTLAMLAPVLYETTPQLQNSFRPLLQERDLFSRCRVFSLQKSLRPEKIWAIGKQVKVFGPQTLPTLSPEEEICLVTDTPLDDPKAYPSPALRKMELRLLKKLYLRREKKKIWYLYAARKREKGSNATNP